MRSILNKHDFEWMLTLFGTAVGAGILFLPIQAGLGGIWPMIAVTLIIFPLTYLSHRGITRIVASNKEPKDITGVVEQDLGKNVGFAVSILYFLSIVTICVGYATGVTNLVESFLENQMGISGFPRPLLCLLLLLLLTSVIVAGEKVLITVTSLMVYPLIVILFGLSIYMMPEWNLSVFEQPLVPNDVLRHVLLIFPLLVFAMNFSPICSAFGLSYRERCSTPEEAVKRTDKIIFWNCLILLIFVMFFVFSMVLSSTPESIKVAKAENIDILTMISLNHHHPLIRYFVPLLAFFAIASSYFGHFLGTREGLNSIVRFAVERKNSAGDIKSIRHLNKYTTIALVLFLWALAVYNPSILNMIGMLSAPIIALYCYIMPVVMMRRIPRLAIYRTRFGGVVFVMGLVAITGYTLAEMMA